MKTFSKFIPACAALAIAGLAATSSAQVAALVNGSFETPNGANDNPLGWKDFTNAGERWRFPGDGLGAFVARTGTNCIELASGNNFGGFTTDKFEFELGSTNNVVISVPGPDITVSGWYRIPAGQPLVGANAGLKLEFRRPNNSIATAAESLTISGTTNGEWVRFELVVPNSDLTLIAEQFPPKATSVSILALRFGSFSATGTVFFDDIEFRQGCPSDFDQDGFVTGDDFDAYVAAFELGSPSSDFDKDGFVTGVDFDAYVAAFESGC